MGEFVKVELDGSVGVIRLDRPKMNALNVQVQKELHAAAIECTDRDDVRACVIYGGERVFAAGADIKEMEAMGYSDMAKHSGRLQDAFKALARIPKPVIAAITGYAPGGGRDLAPSADFRVAADDAKLGQPEILLGVIPGAGGTRRLPRLVGPSKAKDLIFSGRQVGAAEALAIGLVDRVVPAGDVYKTAVEWAASFANGPALALKAAKEAVDRGLEADLDTGLEIERLQFTGTFATEDRTEGMRAFVAKEKANFSGR